MPEATRRPPVAAIVLDAIALILLGVAIVLTVRTGFLSSVLVDLVAMPIALIAGVVSAVSIAVRIRRWRPVAVVAAIALTVAAVPLGFWALQIASSVTVNPARDAVHAVGATIEAEGGHRICDSGDPGFGPDNIQPWDIGVYAAPARSDLETRLADRAASLGYEVRSDSPDMTAKGISVSIATGTDGSTSTCGGTTTVPDGQELVRITGSAPPND